MLLLHAKGHQGQAAEPIIGSTRLMKMVFLFEKELRRQFNLAATIPSTALPEFEAYDFGPFSKTVYADLDFLISLGFVKWKRVDTDALIETEALETAYYETLEPPYWRRPDPNDEEVDVPSPIEYRATPMGQSFVTEELLPNLTHEQVDALNEFKARCTSVTLTTLLRYVYTKYPDSASKSTIRDRVLSQ
jgi:hypothetical protein